jgi:hypothetical protein
MMPVMSERLERLLPPPDFRALFDSAPGDFLATGYLTKPRNGAAFLAEVDEVLARPARS